MLRSPLPLHLALKISSYSYAELVSKLVSLPTARWGFRAPGRECLGWGGLRRGTAVPNPGPQRPHLHPPPPPPASPRGLRRGAGSAPASHVTPRIALQIVSRSKEGGEGEGRGIGFVGSQERPKRPVALG